MTKSSSNPHQPLALLEKIGYGLGDFGANLIFQVQMMFLLHYYTEVFGIGVSVAGTLLAIVRIVDAFNDLVMGALADRTRTRWGAYRPWLLFTALPLGISFFLVFAGPQLSENGRILWASVTLVLLIIFYGANNIPYSALGGSLTAIPEQRVAVASWRFNLAMFATFLVQTFTLSLIQYFGDQDVLAGYRWTVFLWSMLAVATALIAFFATSERVQNPAERRHDLGKEVGLLLRDRNWLTLALASALLYVCLALRGSAMLYYFEKVLDREELFGVFNGVGMGCAMLGISCSAPLAGRFGKKRVFLTGMLVSGILTAAFYFVTSVDVYLLFVLQVLFQVAFGATIPVLWGMIADVADAAECQGGLQITALTFAATLFCFKLGLGLGAALTAWLLEWINYRPNQLQLPEAIQGIRAMVSFWPGLLLAASALSIAFYQIDYDREHRIADELRRARQAASV